MHTSNRLKSLILSLILVLLSWSLGICQELPLRHYTTENEVNPLPGTAVTSVFQDRQGFIWFNVYARALIRYDGITMESYDAADNVPPATWSIQQDSSGRLWIGTQLGLRVTDRPLSAYSPGERVHFQAQLDNVQLLDANFSRHSQMAADSKGHIWVTGKRLVIRYLSGPDGQLRADTVVNHAINVEEQDQVTGLLARKNGEVVGISERDYLLEFHPTKKGFTRTKIRINKLPQSPQKPTLHLIEDNSGKLWGARQDGLLWQIESRDSIFRATAYPLLSGLSFTTPIKANNGRLLAGTIGGGLVEWDGKNPEKYRAYNRSNGLLNMVVWDMIQDRENNIWMATNSGLSKMPGDYRAFGHYTSAMSEGSLNMLPDNGVNGLLAEMNWQANPKAPTEKILVAGTVHGMSFIRKDGSREIFQQQNGLHHNAILSFHQDQEGRLWAVGRGGATCFSHDPDLLKLPGLKKPSKSSLFGAPIYLSQLPGFDMVSAHGLEIPLDEKNADKKYTLWLVGKNALLCLVDRTWYYYKKHTGIGPEMRNMAVDNQGYLYIGDMLRGLFRSNTPISLQTLQSFRLIQETTPGFQQFLTVQDSIFSPYLMKLNGDTILQVSPIKWHKSLLWVGAEKGGFAFRNGETQAALPITYRGRDTIRSNFFQTMALDQHNNVLWAGSNTGLAGINLSSGEVIRVVDRRNGLLDNTPWGINGLDMDSQGVLYWGTPKGLVLYTPSLDGPDTIPPLLSLRQFNFEQDNWGNNELLLEYACLSFYDEKDVKFQTRLLGYDHDWSAITSDSRIRYTNLPAFFSPKTYVFEVRAMNTFGIWTPLLSQQFSVLPPYWFRWWALLAYAVLLFALIFAFVKWRTRAHEVALAKERQISEQLRQVDALKDQFLANTSHELRTPLNGIIGLSESLVDRTADHTQKSDLNLIISSGKRLANLVNDILDFSKLKNDQLILQLGPVDLHTLTNVILKLTQPLLGNKDLRLSNRVPEDISLVEADENRVQQILHNLVGNAVKFTEIGEVSVHAEIKGEILEVTVSDTGIGIAPDKFESIFNAFEQADGSTARSYGGAGLGLAVTRQLVEAHGGKIWLASSLNTGSNFTFSLPLSQAKREKRTTRGRMQSSLQQQLNQLDTGPADLPAALTSVEITNGVSSQNNTFHILIVDDEPVNLRVLKNHLSLEGYQVTTASNGLQALDILRGGQKFDLIILDIMMPRMSGYEVCQELRDIFLPSELPVVMLTAKNRVNDLVDGFNAGANDYLTKPFSKDELLSRIKTHLHLHGINRATSKFIPNEFLRSIGRKTITEVRLGDLAKREVTVFFSDIRSFTPLVEEMTPEEAFKFVHAYNRRIGPIIQRYDGFVNQYLGDGIMALFTGRTSDALRSAIEMQKVIQDYNLTRTAQGRRPIQVGMGLHAGPLIMGVIGDDNRLNPAIIADTVNTASRIENLTKHFGAHILLSDDILSRLENQEAFHIRPLGKFQLKGKQEPVTIYECFDGDETDIFQRKLNSAPYFEQGVSLFFDRRFTEAETAFQQALTIYPHDQPARLFLDKITILTREGIPADWTGVEIMTVK